MKGYIYITGKGADPGLFNNLNDPILFAKTPTLGACMPNIRRLVTKGDFVFVVSGKTARVQQYVVGGFKVNEKISALAAFRRFPENRLEMGENGLQGNVVVDGAGKKHQLDHHSPDTFEKRIENYLVGTDGIALETPREVELGRQQTLSKLSQILNRPRGNRVIDVMSRWSKLDEKQVNDMLDWLRGIKTDSV
ncbi:hypothetical protein [Ferrovibrio sp.]|uniref:hypothetical protein n=1 Tax=Ferrovibrio sp. TaxID=1917215 RepID=UPI0035199D10